jgi:light-harvesting complex I chlorophyll a/b binding protein 1
MIRAIFALLTLAVVAAFTTNVGKVRLSNMRMAADNVFPPNPTSLYGDIAPTGFFDPLGLSVGKDPAVLKQWRDAEIKHGRVCMLATVGILTQELLKNPLGIDGPGIRHFDLVDEKFPEFGELFILLCAFVEGWTIQNKWEPKSVTKGLKRLARLREDVEPGDLNWDPLEWYPSDPKEQEIIKTKELQNGRLAMLGFAGIVLQELTDGKEVLCHFQKVCE